ncbi:hypothetical protein HI914_06746 [Erysiphe necator]|nr:hypothetical protein HI914_06746 [Erysiphe necator]
MSSHPHPPFLARLSLLQGILGPIIVASRDLTLDIYSEFIFSTSQNGNNSIFRKNCGHLMGISLTNLYANTTFVQSCQRGILLHRRVF